jgi:hypothetical protein
VPLCLCGERFSEVNHKICAKEPLEFEVQSLHNLIHKRDYVLMVENPDENKYSKNNIEVGDVHQPLKKTHLLLGRPKPVFGFSVEQI